MLNRFLIIAALLVATGCETVERADDQIQPQRADRSFRIDVPRIMRGTIAQEAVLVGYEPVLVRGYGLVVGLSGTGSALMPPDVRAHMLAEMGRRGVGDESHGMGHVTGEQLLDSPNTAVVIVEGLVPPASVGRRVRRGLNLEGTRFDVRVIADPRSGVTSLEGGRLWTCDLRPSTPAEAFPPTGSQQAAVLAVARGPVFVNPFAEPGEARADASNGRILRGGQAISDIPLKLRLATPNHARAEVLQAAINTRFPREPGMSDITARGEGDETIRITVPRSYREDTQEFVRLLQHTSLQPSRAESIAASIRRIVRNDPIYSEEATWRWLALGVRVLPAIRELYDYPEVLPRMAALRAGAGLDDALTIAPLIDMTSADRTFETRLEAISLLADHRLDPRIDNTLRDLVSDDDVDIRIAAYEAMAERGDPIIDRSWIGDKFRLEVVPSDYDMIYVTEAGEPRLVVFGNDQSLPQPLFVDIWSGRLLARDGENDSEVDVYYRPSAGGGHVILTSSRRMRDFIAFLAHDTTPEFPDPGLGLTYQETIGALYAMKADGVLDAEFRAARDRIRAAIARFSERTSTGPRPEFEEEARESDPDFERLRPLQDDLGSAETVDPPVTDDADASQEAGGR